MLSIDQKTYRKDLILPPGKGYGMRPGGIKPTSIIIHTTNNAHATAFETEATYLRTSLDVSTHYLVGKSGQIVEILSPALRAWHAGEAVTAWNNDHSIGIEAHVSVGEAWTTAQRAALTELVRALMQQYAIAPVMIETHRKVALPPGRKRDPESFSDQDFAAWRAALVQPKVRRFRVRGVAVFQRQDLTGTLAGHLKQDEIIEVDLVYANGSGHLASGFGFIDLDLNALEEIR